MSRQSRFDARYWMLGAGAVGRLRGMVWVGRREEGSGWGACVYLWWIHFDIWQNQYNIVKLKNKIKKKKYLGIVDWRRLILALGKGFYLLVIWREVDWRARFPGLDTVDVLGQVVLLWGAVMDTVGFLAAFLLSFITCTPFPVVMTKNVCRYCWNLPCKCLYFYMEGFWITFFFFAFFFFKLM